MENKEPFYVGLCLAGAVSAGAYTAGVIDFLIEALDEWEKMRDSPGVPHHRVVIPVIGGASAGGMTALMTAAAIYNPIPPVRTVEEATSKNLLWNSWVNLTSDDMFPELLLTNDIDEHGLQSLFNSSFIDEIANRVFKIDQSQWQKRPYFERELKIFTTVSSLRGFSFDIGFLGNEEKHDLYCVTQHNDYITFALNAPERVKGWIPLDLRTGVNVDLAKSAAMATGAFPVGLKPRRIVRSAVDVNDNFFLNPITNIAPVKDDPYETLNVDGGAINNEPFDRVRDVLADITDQKDRESYNCYNGFKSTVLMVDPFPSSPPEYNRSDKFFHVLGSTLSMLLNQARIKPSNLIMGINDEAAGQYLISPRRKVILSDKQNVELSGSEAIACGAFEGFSGFFHKEFRIHDYFLGRANCEKFLRDHFTVPEETKNAVTEGYKNLNAKDLSVYYASRKESPDVKHLPIIPVLFPRKDGKYMPKFSGGSDWPTISEKQIDRLKPAMKKRIHLITMNLVNYNWWMKSFIWIGSILVLRHRIAKYAMELIKDSLINHGLLKSDTLFARRRTQRPKERRNVEGSMKQS